MKYSVMQVCKPSFIATALAWAMLCAPPPVRAATPYQAQLGGRVNEILSTLIIGEFGGRTRANTDATLNKRICQPRDYDDLREAAKDNATLIAFHKRCRLIEFRYDETHVYSTAYLPSGHCQTLKASFEAMLAAHVYAVPSTSKDWLIFEYKGLRLEMGAADREMIRRAQLQATCRDDGSLRISAPRRPRSA
jgi:hypothetical protein